MVELRLSVSFAQPLSVGATCARIAHRQGDLLGFPKTTESVIFQHEAASKFGGVATLYRGHLLIACRLLATF